MNVVQKVKFRASIGETQSSHCQRITPLPRRMTENVSDATLQRCRRTFCESFVAVQARSQGGSIEPR